MYTPSQLHDIRKMCMVLAHSLRKEKGWTMSVALRWAWKMIRSDVVINVAGVTFGRRQEAIERLLRYSVRRVVFTLRHTPNPADENAVAVDVTVIGKGTAQVGFLPRNVAAIIAPLLDHGCCPVVQNWHVTGEYLHGLRLHMALVPGLIRKTAGAPAAKQMGARIAIR